jgi:hypothetical protein
MTGLALPALMAMVLSAGLILTAAASGTPTASTTAAADYLPAEASKENADTNARPHRDPTIVLQIASAVCSVNLEGVPALGALCGAFENAGLVEEAKCGIAIAIVKQARASNPDGLRALVQELDIDWMLRPERPERSGDSGFGLRQGRPFGNNGQFSPDDGQS